MRFRRVRSSSEVGCAVGGAIAGEGETGGEGRGVSWGCEEVGGGGMVWWEWRMCG